VNETVNREELERRSEEMAAWRPAEILSWAVERFPRIAFATGFGVEGCVLIDVISRARLPIDLFTLDTGLLFPETYALWLRLEERYGVTVRALLPERSVAEQARDFGDRLWDREPERCCEMRKVAPLRRALAGLGAWVTAIRREQTRERSGVEILEWDGRFDLAKVNPLAHWTAPDVWRYVRENDVPFNPLHERGYPSIGCVPCTSAVLPGEEPRAGRWRGREKKECGIHVAIERPVLPRKRSADEERSGIHAR
jgi:phosphoadenylyl-sulfate reductase (thioredoxin)